MFYLSNKSFEQLEHVDVRLAVVVAHALTITPTDFTVLEGLRSKARQVELVASGASKTLNSKHLADERGLSRAVDLGAFVGGTVRWDWPLYYSIAEAMRSASIALGVEVRWGGVWDRKLNELRGGAVREEVGAYVARRNNMGKDAFIDGPHYEIHAG